LFTPEYDKLGDASSDDEEIQLFREEIEELLDDIQEQE
jgi:hypothetical protein